MAIKRLLVGLLVLIFLNSTIDVVRLTNKNAYQSTNVYGQEALCFGNIYLFDDSCILHCIDPLTGEEKWNFESNSDYPNPAL